jgi:phosphate transport system permease protein
MIVNITLQALEKVPAHLKESGIALGGSSFEVMIKISLPAAKKRIASGILLSIAQVLGVTAPLIVTMQGASRINWDIDQPVNTVSLLIWNFLHNPALTNLMWSAALFLVILIILLNVIAKYIYPQDD